jgi:hypothetical protein
MKNRDSRPISLWSIIETLQRRLEGQGLTGDVIDAAVITTLARAMSTMARA